MKRKVAVRRKEKGPVTEYGKKATRELNRWKKSMKRAPSLFNRISKNMQVRMNRIIPEKVHQIISTAIEHMTRAVLAGAGFTTAKLLGDVSFEAREALVLKRIKFYRNTATAEGAITGAGGIVLGLADFPIWLTLKMKMLFDIAALYGYDVDDIKERVYILHIFQLTFSSQQHRRKIVALMEGWEEYSRELPAEISEFDWRTFQQEYRDYIDLAKLLQLVPGIGAAVGAYVNHRLTQKLGTYAMQSYRMRALNSLQ